MYCSFPTAWNAAIYSYIVIYIHKEIHHSPFKVHHKRFEKHENSMRTTTSIFACYLRASAWGICEPVRGVYILLDEMVIPVG